MTIPLPAPGSKPRCAGRRSISPIRISAKPCHRSEATMMGRAFSLALALMITGLGNAGAQDAAPAPEYLTRPATTETGKAPGLKATELSSHVRTFQLVFAKGDEVGAGLAEFAEKNHLTVSHFTAIGAFDAATIGW